MLVYCGMEYRNVLWEGSHDADVSKLESIHDSALRIIKDTQDSKGVVQSGYTSFFVKLIQHATRHTITGDKGQCYLTSQISTGIEDIRV